ncbi:MAG: PhoH family protein [Candidatus Aenigmarchaeota archaeon]|nr:PhoH family protein [Candidatus Aenigmarchaeota archaeon]
MSSNPFKKTFVVDTSVIFHDPFFYKNFGDNDIVIPGEVFGEIDKYKTEPSFRGKAARSFARTLESLQRQGNLREGVPHSENSGKIYVSLEDDLRGFPGLKRLGLGDSDTRIIETAYALQKKFSEKADDKDKKDISGHVVIVLSKDRNLRIAAGLLNIFTEDYRYDRVDPENIYYGIKRVDFTVDDGMKIYDVEEFSSLTPNEFVIDSNDSVFEAINIGGRKKRILRSLTSHEAFGISGKNPEQIAALYVLMNPGIQLVTLFGEAGTGKTLLALAAGLQQVYVPTLNKETRYYNRLFAAKPIVPVGNDIGFLPGLKESKLLPWLQPIFDNLESLIEIKKNAGEDIYRSQGKKPKKVETALQFYEMLAALDLIQLEAMTYVRGRNIARQYMIIDEAQNLTPHEVKTILTRAGEGTKVVFTGDPYQIDRQYLDPYSNGMSFLSKKFRGWPKYASIQFNRGERSELASEAIARLYR